MAAIVQHKEVKIASSGTTFLITFLSGVTSGSTLFFGMADNAAPVFATDNKEALKVSVTF